MLSSCFLKMKRYPFLATLIPFLFLLSSPTVYSYTKSEISGWCSQTPHPQTCEYFLTKNQDSGPVVKQSHDLIKALIKVTLGQAQHAESNTRRLGPKCHNSLEKAAWEDCLELYENTVERINMTINPRKPCSQYEMQTWLSTALTDLETCRVGFEELGVGGSIVPLLKNNVSVLLSNALAMNRGASPSNNDRQGFPTWVKSGDRKLLQSSTPASQANVVVAQDGSGNYKTIGEAIAAAGKRSGSGRYVIYVKAGTYKENIEIGTKLKNIMLLGDGIGKSIVTGSKSVVGGSTTFNSAAVAVVGDGFIGRGITIRNTAGPQNHQAVALRSGSDLSVFYQCSFEGYQDTLYVHSDRQFYKECNIYGTVDFIFGNAAVVFQNCNIYARNPPNKINTVTAQGRTDPNQNTGISIQHCRVMAASDLTGSVKTYLGRPWKQYSRTVFLETFIDGLVEPAGWLPWSGNFALDTLYYGEYMNTGSGSSTANRVKWKGYHVITSATEAAKFTVGNFIAGGSWLPATNVPFTSGL